MTAVEDIFADWNSNFARIKRPRSNKPRVRKISHRAERKEMVKEAKKAEEALQGPFTYSQIVRKNLKIPQDQPCVEEIFGTWMKSIDKLNKTPKATNEADDIEVFKCWNFIFGSNEVKPAETSPPPISAFECGQPTVPKIPPKVQKTSETAKQQKKDTKMAATKASKKQSIEKLSEKLLHEGYPLTNSEKVEKVLDMAEKKVANESAIGNVVKPDSKAPQAGKEQPVVVRNKMQVVPYVEKKSEKENMEELYRKMKTEMPKVVPVAKDFKPSEHSQRYLVKDNIKQSFIGPINKPNIPKEDLIELNKPNLVEKSPLHFAPKAESKICKPSWTSIISKNEEESGRGEVKKYKTEEIFDQWRHIFVFENRQRQQPKRKEIVLKQDIYFMEWLRNFDEPITPNKRERSSKSSSEEKSPKPSKRDTKKQLRIQDIEDDVIEMKDNRRNDFMKATMIRDKKRTEASRNSLGKRVK